MCFMKQYFRIVVSVLLALVLLNYSPELSAQRGKADHDANVIGHVVDRRTGEHLPGATIQIKGTTMGTATDATGHYFFRLMKPGRMTLVMQALGYKTQERVIDLGQDSMLEVNFEAVEDDIHLDEVVVSSNRQATLRRLAPTLVNVLDRRTFEAVNANNLAQGLVFQPGIRVETNCQNCGFSQVRINGLDGRYSQILIDSRPIMSALAGVYGLEQIPANMIERVEVVRGGGSALFGSSAIAGVINIITREPLSNSVSLTESLGLTGLKSLDNNLAFNASVVSDDSRAGAMIFGQARYRDGHDVNDDGFTEMPRLDTRALGFRGYLRPSNLTKITAEVHTFGEERRGGDHLDLPEHVAGIAESLRHSVYSGNLKFDLFSASYKHHLQLYASGQLIRRNSYYGGIGEPDAKTKDGKIILDSSGNPIKGGKLGYPIHPSDFGVNNGISHGSTWLVGGQYTYDIERLLFMPAQVLLGAEYVDDRLSDKMTIREWYTPEYLAGGHGGTTSLSPYIDQTIRNVSQFAQLEWRNKHWSILVGGRLDFNSAMKSAVLSPRATLRFNPTERINLRATYAKGFRAPQVFDEDLHVSVVNGEAQRITNADNLRPEISHSYSLSADTYFRLGRGGAQLNLLAEVFHTRLLDVFTNNKLKSEHGITYFERNNYGIDDEGKLTPSGAKITGANVEAKLAYKWLNLQAGLTLTSNEYDALQEWGTRQRIKGLTSESEYLSYTPASNGSSFDTEVDDEGDAQVMSMRSRQILRTPNVYGYFTLGIAPVKSFNISLSGTYTGQMYVPHAIVWGQGTAMTDRGAIASGLRTEGYMMTLTRSGASVLDDSGAPVKATAQWDELVRTPSFFDLGVKLTYDISIFRKTNLQLFFGMNNLFNAFQSDYDQGPDRDSAYIYGPMSPRSGYAGLKFSF